jgi:hypothetical protein
MYTCQSPHSLEQSVINLTLLYCMQQPTYLHDLLCQRAAFLSGEQEQLQQGILVLCHLLQGAFRRTRCKVLLL